MQKRLIKITNTIKHNKKYYYISKIQTTHKLKTYYFNKKSPKK